MFSTSSRRMRGQPRRAASGQFCRDVEAFGGVSAAREFSTC